MDSSNGKSSSISRILDATQDFPLDITMSRSQISFDHENSPSCADLMPSKSLNDLPELCLLAVFKRIPLIELLRNVRLVNTRLCQLVPTELKRRRSLVIVDDRTFNLSDLQLDKYQSSLIEHVRRDDGLTPWSRLPPIDYMNLVDRNTRYSENNPLHNQVPPEMITTLMNNLPRINSLTVVQGFFDLSALDQIVRMIDHWRGELVSLKLYLHHDLFLYLKTYRVAPPNHKAQLKAQTFALFDSINRATSLKHLKLKFYSFYMKTPFTRPPLTILAQLSTFDSNAFNDNLDDEQARYASTNRDLKIVTTCSLEFILGIKPNFCDRFVDVTFDNFHNGITDNFKRFCTRFTSLVHLNINNQQHIPVTRLTQCLSSLTQLVHLRVRLPARRLEDNLPAEQQELPPDEIVPILSVRLLTIQLIIRTHSSTEQFHLHQVFPNVQVLDIETITVGCSDCGINFSQIGLSQNPENVHLLRECAQMARRPFRRFPRLHTIQIDANDVVYLSDTKDKILITREQL